MARRAISPLIATILLIAFALLIGTATMNWGKAYVDKIDTKKGTGDRFDSAIIISLDKIDTPLKELQIKYITGQISAEEYFEKEKEVLNKG